MDFISFISGWEDAELVSLDNFYSHFFRLSSRLLIYRQGLRKQQNDAMMQF